MPVGELDPSSCGRRQRLGIALLRRQTGRKMAHQPSVTRDGFRLAEGEQSEEKSPICSQ